MAHVASSSAPTDEVLLPYTHSLEPDEPQSASLQNIPIRRVNSRAAQSPPPSNAKDSIAFITSGRSHMHATALVVQVEWT
jgi:hypothetical protein